MTNTFQGLLPDGTLPQPAEDQVRDLIQTESDPLPDGGAVGDVLTRTGDGATWTKAPSGLPSGGTAGQFLSKTTTGTAWVASPSVLPSGGTEGQVLTRTGGSAAWSSPTGRWDLDALAIARGYHEVLSATEPTTVQYTASNGQTYPVVWVKAQGITVPVLPEEPYWDRPSSTVSVPALVGIGYFVTGWKKGAATTWNGLNVKLTPSTNVKIATVTGQSLPVSVRVEARAQPGYEMPTTFVYSHDFPDPNATAVVTSDTFTGGDTTTVNARMTDAALGGVAKQWVDPSNILKISSGRLVPTGTQSQASIAIDALNMEAEFDLIRTDGLTGKVSGTWSFLVGSTGGWGSGFGFQGIRVMDKGSNRSDGNSQFYIGPTPDLGYPGHYKITVVGQTGTITVPSGVVYTVQLRAPRTTTETKFMIQCQASTDLPEAIDNLVLRQVGF